MNLDLPSVIPSRFAMFRLERPSHLGEDLKLAAGEAVRVAATASGLPAPSSACPSCASLAAGALSTWAGGWHLEHDEAPPAPGPR